MKKRIQGGKPQNSTNHFVKVNDDDEYYSQDDDSINDNDKLSNDSDKSKSSEEDDDNDPHPREAVADDLAEVPMLVLMRTTEDNYVVKHY